MAPEIFRLHRCTRRAIACMDEASSEPDPVLQMKLHKQAYEWMAEAFTDATDIIERINS